MDCLHLKILPNSGPQPLFEISASTFSMLVAASFIGTFILTYAIFIANRDDKTFFLPTMGYMWNVEPNNFISRHTIGVGCVMMYCLHYIVYVANKNRGLYQGRNNLGKALLGCVYFAVFSFSVMAAVCSSENDAECLGNSAVHAGSSLVFFVGYNIYVGALLYLEHNRSQKPPESRILHWISMIFCLISKIRFFISASSWSTLLAHQPMSIVALLEWADYLVIISFTAHYVSQHCKMYRIGLLTSGDEPSRPVILNITAKGLVSAAVNISTVLLSSCLVLALAFRTVSWDKIPLISDTFVYPPGNYISRWSGTLGTTFLTLFHVLFWFVYKDFTSKAIARLFFALSFIAGIALSMVMVVSETENQTIHVFSAVVMFLFYDVFIVAFLIVRYYPQEKSKKLSNDSHYWLWSWIFWIVVVIVLAFVAYFVYTYMNFLSSLAATLEWSDAFAIMGFLYALPIWYGSELSSVRYVVLQDDDTLEIDTDAPNPAVYTLLESQ